MHSDLTNTLLGNEPASLRSDVTFAPPLTLARIVGRTPVAEALDAYARVIGASAPDLALRDENFEALVFTGAIDGQTMQLMTIVSRDEDGLVATIDTYGRPWPYMALVRDKLAGIRPSLTEASLGDRLYVADGPGSATMDPPAIPPFADDVSFYSPFLTAVATGKDISQRILQVASQIYGEQKFRAVLEVEGRPGIAGVFDGIVDGHTLQLVAIFGLNDRSEIDEIRLFSRPWPVTAHFRSEMYEHLKGVLGPEFWQGPDPRTPVPSQ